MTVQELVEKLKDVPQDLEVYGFDYGDDQVYPVSEVSVWHPDDEINKQFYYINQTVLMIK